MFWAYFCLFYARFNFSDFPRYCKNRPSVRLGIDWSFDGQLCQEFVPKYYSIIFLESDSQQVIWAKLTWCTTASVLRREGNQCTACNKIIPLILKISRVGCPSISLVISAQFTLKMCTSAKNFKNTKTHYFGGSLSFKVIDVDTTKKLVASACYNKQHVCAYLQQFSR